MFLSYSILFLPFSALGSAGILACAVLPLTPNDCSGSRRLHELLSLESKPQQSERHATLDAKPSRMSTYKTRAVTLVE